jgi:hypothetical protein
MLFDIGRGFAIIPAELKAIIVIHDHDCTS